MESREQYEIVKDMAIAMLQGYYFDRPMKEELFEEKVCARQTGGRMIYKKACHMVRDVLY